MIRSILITLSVLLPLAASAMSRLDGLYQSPDSGVQVRLTQFDQSLTMTSQSFYSTGQPVNWFFEFTLPAGRDVNVGESISGQVRSLDSYYNCAFEEQAFIQIDDQGQVRIHYPTLTYHRETQSVQDRHYSDGGYYSRREMDWNGWGWVKTAYAFPIERWRVISSQCVIDQRNWRTDILVPVSK